MGSGERYRRAERGAVPGSVAASSWRSFAGVHASIQGLVLGLGLGPARDPDLGFHLATGRAILASGRIPATNVLSFAEPDAPALHSQWLGAVLFELTHDAFGIAGPILLKCAVLGLTAAVLVETARLLGARPSAALLALSLGALVASERFVERPLIWSNLALALVAHGLAVRGTPSPSLRARRRAAWVTVGALVASVHLHGGAVFGFLLLLASSLTHLAAALPWGARLGMLARRDALREAKAHGAMLLTSAGLAALTLWTYHPHAARVLTVPFTMATDPFLHRHLVEFRPPYAFAPRELLPFWVLAAATALTVLGGLGRLRVTLLLPMAFGLVLALRHVRFVDLLALLAAPGLASVLSRLMTRRPGAVHGRAVAGALTACVVVASALLVLERGGPGVGYDPRVYPRALLADLDRLGVQGPAFVQDGWAGPYLGFRYPHERVFFHPAFDFYTYRFFRESYMRTRDGEPGWERTLDQHGVTLVLMKYTSDGERRRQSGRPNLRQRLARDPGWALVTFDAHGLAFARREALTGRGREATIEGLDVDRLAFLERPARALGGLLDLQARGMRSERATTLSVYAERDRVRADEPSTEEADPATRAE